MRHPIGSLPLLLLSLVALAVAAPAAAAQHTSSDLLLPYFEVELGAGRTTHFAVGNGKADPVEVQVAVYSNWGIPVLRLALDLDPGEVVNVDLRDWIEAGALPGQTLGPAHLAHVQAALTGQPSPKDGLYYGTPVEPDLAVGFVTFRIAGSHRPSSLWGDYSWLDAAGEAAEGGLLVDVDARSECRSLCDRHLVRFLNPADLAGTELVVWTGRYAAPSPDPEPQFLRRPVGGNAFYREDGVKFDQRMLDLLPVSLVPLAELGLSETSGWIDVVSDGPIYVGTRYNASDRFAVAVDSWCQKEPPPAPLFVPRAAIDLEKLTAGVDADLPPGPALEIGTAVTWQYVVTNTGNVRLSDIVVSDNRGVAVSCPGSTLVSGQSMTCTGSGVVQSGLYSNVGTATANPPSGSPVTDSDPSHYQGVAFLPGPAIAIEKLTNGHTADQPPGPTLVAGDPVTWTYSVTNVGGTVLTGVTVTDSDPAVVVSCPKTVLAVFETMVCSASGTAVLGQYANTGTASGNDGEVTVTSLNESHYFGMPEPPPASEPAVSIEKLTNGFDADGVASAPQLYHGHPVLWTYVVTNTGNAPLTDVAVSDDQGVAVSCPKTALEPGEQMICTGSGTAVASEECYENVGTVVGTPPEGDNVTDSDPSHYCAEEVPGVAAIALEKLTNGEDADVAPGPTLLVGDNVQWVYVVTNPGDVTLTGVTVSDDQGVAVTCSGGQPFVLAPGAVKTCFGNGLAQLGQYANVGTATGTPEGGGAAVSDGDPSHYFGEEEVLAPAIALEKLTNGEDADTPTGPTIAVGATVTWTYLVTNVGDVALTAIVVTDDQGVAVACPKTTLQVGESMTCIGLGLATAGQYANLGTATGNGGETSVSASDPSHYFGQIVGDQGCTPGYWKNHTDSWPPTGYATSQKVKDVFASAGAFPTQGNATLLDGLSFNGGPGVDGAAEILLRAAVAALLNAAHPGVAYPRTVSQVLAAVDAALASGDRDTMLALAASLDADNNLGCPLN